jgi:hypothetical protein
MVMVIEAQEDHSHLIPRLKGFGTAKPCLQARASLSPAERSIWPREDATENEIAAS